MKTLGDKTPFEAWYGKKQLGYSTSRKGYRLYDQKTSSSIHSHDVVFNESSRGYGCKEEKHLIQEPEVPEPEEDSDRVESRDDSSEPKEMTT